MAQRLPPGITSRRHVPRGATKERTQYRATVSDPGKRTSSGRVGRATSRWFDTLSEARDWHDERRDQVRRYGTASGGSAITVSEGVDLWLEVAQKVGHQGRKEIRKSTADRHGVTIENHIKPTIGLLRMAELRAGSIRRWVDDQVVARGRLETARALEILKGAYDYLVSTDELLGNPAASIKLSKRIGDDEIGVVSSFMEPEVVEKLLRGADDLAAHGRILDSAASEGTRSGAGHFSARAKAWSRHRPLVYLLIASGVRIGEALALQWQDIDFDAGAIRVEKTVDSDGKVGPPKTRSSIRTVPLGGHMMDILKAMPGNHLDAHYVFGGAKPADRHNLSNRAWKTLMTLVGLVDEKGTPLWSFHDCRHFHASVLIGAGMDPQQVCERLGHANVTTTLRIYTHLFKARRGLKNRRAVELEGALLGLPSA